jgi:hypothetical protein
VHPAIDMTMWSMRRGSSDQAGCTTMTLESSRVVRTLMVQREQGVRYGTSMNEGCLPASLLPNNIYNPFNGSQGSPLRET